MYSPALGRWLSPDPTGIAGGDNLYEYAKNDPIDWDDPNGFSPRRSDKQFLDNLYNNYKHYEGGGDSMVDLSAMMRLRDQANAISVFWWGEATEVPGQVQTDAQKESQYYADQRDAWTRSINELRGRGPDSVPYLETSPSTPEFLDNWSYERQKKWLDALFASYGGLIDAAAVKYNVPRALLRIIVVNEMTDRIIRRRLGISSSHGIFAIKAKTALNHNAIDQAVFDDWWKNVRVDNPDAPGRPGVSFNAESYLDDPVNNVDAAGKLLRSHLDNLQRQASAGAFSTAFSSLVWDQGNPDPAALATEIKSLSANSVPSTALIRAVSALWDGGSGVESANTIPKKVFQYTQNSTKGSVARTLEQYDTGKLFVP